ncbi:MAG: hypothetical protein PVJ38_01215 [Candidatus Bathyarchaeota archaeon]
MTHDNRFWSVALTVYAVERVKTPSLRPIAWGADRLMIRRRLSGDSFN